MTSRRAARCLDIFSGGTAISQLIGSIPLFTSNEKNKQGGQRAQPLPSLMAKA